MRRSTFRPSLESLETRTVLAAGLSGGILAVHGQFGDDTIVVSQSGDDVLVTLNSVNSLFPLADVDSVVINGQSGDDTISFTLDRLVTLHGSDGNDTITSRGILGGERVIIYGGTGDDTLSCDDAGEVTITGDGGNDTITSGSTGPADISGGNDDDTITSTDAAFVVLSGGGGNDTITAANVGTAKVYGGTGNDTIDVTATGAVHIHGGSGGDALTSTTAGRAELYGGSENDTLISNGSGGSHLFGGADNDGLTGGFGYNNLQGEAGEDSLHSRGTNNRLRGGTESDTYQQEGGPSVLFVDRLDVYTLRAGLDTAHFEPVLSMSGTRGYVRDTPAITLAPFASVKDADNSGFNGGRLLVRIGEGSDSSNRLAIGSGFTVDADNNVLLGTTIIGKRWSSGFGTKELRIQFNSAATTEIVQQLVRSITFKTVGGLAGRRDVLFSVSDSDHAISAETSKIVIVT